MRPFIRKLFFELGFDQPKGSLSTCADDTALYVETWGDGGTRRYVKLVPHEVSVEEFNAAWDYSTKENE